MDGFHRRIFFSGCRLCKCWINCFEMVAVPSLSNNICDSIYSALIFIFRLLERVFRVVRVGLNGLQECKPTSKEECSSTVRDNWMTFVEKGAFRFWIGHGSEADNEQTIVLNQSMTDVHQISVGCYQFSGSFCIPSSFCEKRTQLTTFSLDYRGVWKARTVNKHH
jgi:hypothetical protein